MLITLISYLNPAEQRILKCSVILPPTTTICFANPTKQHGYAKVPSKHRSYSTLYLIKSHRHTLNIIATLYYHMIQAHQIISSSAQYYHISKHFTKIHSVRIPANAIISWTSPHGVYLRFLHWWNRIHRVQHQENVSRAKIINELQRGADRIPVSHKFIFKL
jgi:hypothetical protein